MLPNSPAVVTWVGKGSATLLSALLPLAAEAGGL